jgi:dienelactone hydrolase
MPRRAQSGTAVLAAQPLVEGRFAAVGYCFGGMVVLELARNGVELAGVVSVHGSLHTSQRAQPKSVKAKILVCRGALDPHVPMSQVSAFVEEMNQAGADWQLIVYGGAMHGFTHTGDSQLPAVQYHLRSDIRSSIAIQDFFSELFSDNMKCFPID